MRYSRKTGVEAAPMQEQTVLYDPERKTFCVLNETAAFLWEALSQPASNEELFEALSETFEISDVETAQRDLADALAHLGDLDLIDSVA